MTPTPTNESTALDRTDTTHWAPPDNAPCVILARTEGAASASRVFVLERVDLFTGEPNPDYDGGVRARDLCGHCRAREACLADKVRQNDKLMIKGAAGGARLRALRRPMKALEGAHDGLSAMLAVAWWAAASAAHFRQLDGVPGEPGDRALLAASGGAREHGRRSCFAAGCRRDDCALAAGMEGAGASGGRSTADALAAWREAA